jgi:hypothetical protein
MEDKSKIAREDVIRILKEQMPALRDRFGVTRLALFGSFAKRNAGAGSDIDLLVKPSAHPD